MKGIDRTRERGGGSNSRRLHDKIFGFALSPATETWHRSLQWLPNSVQRHEKPVCHVARSLDILTAFCCSKGSGSKEIVFLAARYYAADNKTSFLFLVHPWSSLSFRNHHEWPGQISSTSVRNVALSKALGQLCPHWMVTKETYTRCFDRKETFICPKRDFRQIRKASRRLSQLVFPFFPSLFFFFWLISSLIATDTTWLRKFYCIAAINEIRNPFPRFFRIVKGKKEKEKNQWYRDSRYTWSIIIEIRGIDQTRLATLFLSNDETVIHLSK